MAEAPTALLVERHRLASELRSIRRRAKLPMTALADRIHISQPKASRIENARLAVSVADVEAWGLACGLSPAEIEHLIDMARRALIEVVNYREAIKRGLPPVQQEIAALEHLATRIRVYEPFIVPGLLETAAYAQRLYELGHYPPAEIPAAVAARVERQSVLYERGHHFAFLLAEASLRWRLAPAEVYVAQLDRISTIATLPQVEIGILAQNRELPALRWHPFLLFEERSDGGDPLALVELATSLVSISEAQEIAKYEEVFEELWAGALVGQDALDFIAQSRQFLALEDRAYG